MVGKTYLLINKLLFGLVNTNSRFYSLVPWEVVLQSIRFSFLIN